MLTGVDGFEKVNVGHFMCVARQGFGQNGEGVTLPWLWGYF